MQKIIGLFLLAIALNIQAQDATKFNLSFEEQETEANLSRGWFQWGTHGLAIDKIAYSGKRAGKITSKSNSKFGSIAYKIPANYKGSFIKLEGYMKIKDVKDGFAGLLMRVDGGGESLAFDNMESESIQGTRDWKKYSIILPYPEEAEVIFVAGILVGNGEAWFDDFKLTIDGNDVQTLKEIEKTLAKAQLDKEFDTGSAVQFPELDAKRLKDLELLGRVWGFLKYHHPEIAKGNYNWDYELFRFLPDYLKTESVSERDRLIIQWIESLGELKHCTECTITEKDAVLKPDLKWIKKQNKNLKDRLLYVYKNRSQGKQYYIERAKNIGNPIFSKERSYYEMAYPDAGFRLLSVYRYWNMINYFFPYKHLMDKDWNKTLAEYIPRFINASNELEYELVALEIIGDIQDTHANLIGGNDKTEEMKGLYYPPVNLRFIEDQLVVVDYYDEAMKAEVGLEIGDVITNIGDISVQQFIKDNTKYYPASNEPTRLRDISIDILRSPSEVIDITYLTAGGEQKSMKLQLYPKDSIPNFYFLNKKNPDRSFKMLDGNIGYVTLQNIQEEDIPQIKEDFKNTKGIIIDIRNYPSTFVPFSLGSYFISDPSRPFVKFTGVNLNNPGEFTFVQKLEIDSERYTYKGKLIILVNELSQSQAEYTAMAFRAGDNTTILGSTTAGADGNVSLIMLPGGLRTVISGIGVNYPNGEETQRVGIVPDVEVKPTIKGIREGKDELLDKAIEIINNQ
ncbi:MAG: S41 family peptidase [Saprospiraceae bacterium]|nr:S41 family peptidase [Saprospiraceae bacterium]